MTIPLFDGAREFEAHATEYLAAAERVLASGKYILGDEVEAFEREVGKYLHVRHSVGVASGTDALWLALKAAGVGAGDAVVTTPLSFFATAASIVNVGAVPIFVDVDEDTLTLAPEAVVAVLDGRSEPHRRLKADIERVKAIIVVHLFGQPAAMDEILGIASEHGLAVIEDAAQAIGATYRGRMVGTLGNLGCFSFFPTKNLGGFGDGGLVVTDDEQLADRVRRLRLHGATKKYEHEEVGTNSRLDEIQASLLRVRLEHLSDSIAARRANATFYSSQLRSVPSITRPEERPGTTHSYHQYVIRVSSESRDEIRRELERTGIETAVHYPVPLHLQEGLRELGYALGDLPSAEAACSEVVSLPVSSQLERSELELVVTALRKIFGSDGDAGSPSVAGATVLAPGK